MSFLVKGTTDNGTNSSQDHHALNGLGKKLDHNNGETEQTPRTKSRSISFSKTVTQFTQSTIESMNGSTKEVDLSKIATTTISIKELEEEPSSESNKKENAIATKEKKPSLLRKVLSHGFSFRKEKKEDKKSVQATPTTATAKKKGWFKSKSEGVKLDNNRIKAQSDLVGEEIKLLEKFDLNDIEKAIRNELTLLPEKASGTLYRGDEGAMHCVKVFMKQTKCDKWIEQKIIGNEKIKTKMEQLLKEYKLQAHQNFNGEKEKFLDYCGKELFFAVTDAMTAAFSDQQNSMPYQFREIFQIMVIEAKKRFPKTEPEMLVSRMFFLRFIIPALSEEICSLEDISARLQLTNALNHQVLKLSKVPDIFMSLFEMNFKQIEQGISRGVSYATQATTIFRGDIDEYFLLKRWIEYTSSNAWIKAAIVDHKILNNEIDELLIELEDSYEKNFSKVPEEVRLEWGKRLFKKAVESIEATQPIPESLGKMAQALNNEVQKKFPNANSETTVCSMLFLRFFIPPMLILKEGTLTSLSSKERIAIIKCMLLYINNELKEIPVSLGSIFKEQKKEEKQE